MSVCNLPSRPLHVFPSEEKAFHEELKGFMMDVKPIKNILHQFFYGKKPEFPLNEARILNKEQLASYGLNRCNYSLHPDYPNSRFQVVTCCLASNCTTFYVIRRLNSDYPRLVFNEGVVLPEDELAKLFFVVREKKLFSLVGEYSDSYFKSYVLGDGRALIVRKKMKLSE